MARAFRFLLTTAESHPTHRADVRVLFGKYLPMYDITSDLICVVEASGEPPQWPGGKMFPRRAYTRAGIMLAALTQELTLLRRAFNGYQGIIVRDKPILGLIGLIAARVASIPYIYWMSFPLPEVFLRIGRNGDGTVSWLRRLYGYIRGHVGYFVLYRVLVPRADHLFVQSAVMRQELRSKGLTHDRVTAVPMGVDLEAIPPKADTSQALFANRRMAVYLGTLDRVRNPEVMVDAAIMVARVIPEFLLLIVGETDDLRDKGWLRRYAADKGAGGIVHFTGRLPFDEGLAYARLAEVGLSPFPRNELLESASPTKAVEYMALGLPVVCNDQPDQAQVIQASGAGFCVDLSSSAFADAIITCLSDPAKARAMGDAGQAYVKRNRNYQMLGAMVADQLASVVATRGVKPTVRQGEN